MDTAKERAEAGFWEGPGPSPGALPAPGADESGGRGEREGG